jgi:O-methyltransferase involved in polyketide biosynthesis
LKAEDKFCNVCGVKFEIKGGTFMTNTNHINQVSETLYIPLLAKAKESQQLNPIVIDLKAMEIISELDPKFDTSKFDGGEIADLGIISRTEILDNEIRKLLKSNKHLSIINIGAGLDTRVSRIKDENISWYDIDLPEVIDLRKKYFSEYEQIKFIPKSVLDPSWTEDIQINPAEFTVIIAEGLLMYFPENKVKQIMSIIGKKFSGSHMYFDVVHSYFVGKGISSKFLWGIDKAKDIEKMGERIALVNSWSTGDLHKERQSLFFRVMNILPATKNRSQIIHICFN